MTTVSQNSHEAMELTSKSLKKNYIPCTNNAVEDWSSNFVKVVKSKDPSFPKLIEKFKDEQKNAEILFEKM